MAYTWNITGNATIDSNGKVTFNDHAAGTYVVTCTDGDRCGKFTITRSGGNCDDPPTPPVGTCPDYGTTYNTNDSLTTIFSTELNCVEEKSDWRATTTNCDAESCEGGWTVIIKNTSNNIYVPFNGSFRVAKGDGTSFDVLYRVSNVTTPAGQTGAGSHYWYGATADKTQDTNFLVPPGYQVELRNCVKNNNNQYGSTYFQFAYMKNSHSSTSVADYKLHNQNVGINTSTAGTSISDHKLVFTVTGGTYWEAVQGNTYAYGISISDYNSNKCSVFYTNSGAYKYLVPINVYRSATGNWNGYNPLTPADSDMIFTAL